MIKKLDILIIKAFIGPFLATFFISLFVLVMQFFWLWLDDFVGKGLDVFTIFELIGYVSATAVPLALPLALLLSSIMTFGNLGETFELVAIKSSGIPLLRFMMPLVMVALLIAGVSFLFSNNVIPVANLKMNTLKYDIVVAKPAFDIKEGVFYDKIEGYVIKLGKKEKNDSTIRNVIIFEKNYGLQDHMMIAESGIMRVTPDKRYLEFTLRNGWRYQEKGNRGTTNTEFIRLGFKEYKKIFDLSSFKLNKTDDSLFQDNEKMLTLRQLNKNIDSLQKDKSSRIKIQRDIGPILKFVAYADSVQPELPAAKVAAKTFDQLIPDSVEFIVADRASAQINACKSSLDVVAADQEAIDKSLRYNKIEWHRKFTLSFACIVLFMIGAPLGSIIRKGGLGLPLVTAVIFFIVFHLFNTFGEKFVKENVTSAFVGMWLSTMVLLPIGAFLTYKAMHDSQLFNKEYYFRFLRKTKNVLANFKP